VFLCPLCDNAALDISCAIELPPELTSGDELTLQVVSCGWCSFRGAAICEDSRRGSLQSEFWRHYCFAAPPESLDNLSRLIESCPKPSKRRCSCAGHLTIGRRDDLGRWDPPVPTASKTFPMKHPRKR
jgi:hypothetical protein